MEKKKIIIAVVAVLVVAIVCACVFLCGGEGKPREEALAFKEEYESINGKTARGDYVYRSLNIDEKNPYIKVTVDDIVQKINNKESFYLYVGDPLCPWCRSGLEKMIEVAIKEGIKDIYYIDFWDDDHNEILRDLYEVKEVDGELKLVQTQEATPGYKELLKAVDNYVQKYTIIKDGVEYDTEEKRIMGGDHFYFSKGECNKYVSLRSDVLSNAFDELTEEVLNDQKTKFTEFFTHGNACDGESDC